MSQVDFLNHPLIDALEDYAYLLTREIAPISDREVMVHIAEGIVGAEPREMSGIKNVKPIAVTDASQNFTFKFCEVVSWAVSAEMFAEHKKDELFEGGRVRLYSRSHFLTYVGRTTWAEAYYADGLGHYQINTLDHRIDVVTAEPPEIMSFHGS